MRHGFWCVGILCLLLALVACSAGRDAHDTGEWLDKEALDSILLSVEDRAQTTHHKTETKDITTSPPEDGVYYWTEKGSVWHTWKDCGYLSGSLTVFEGCVDDAIAAGKERPCSRCVK